MLAITSLILAVFWALGLGFHIAGPLIHILLVLSVLTFALHLLTGHREGEHISIRSAVIESSHRLSAPPPLPEPLWKQTEWNENEDREDSVGKRHERHLHLVG